ncbi:hypothetical protein Q8G47_29250, partial [Klebsiella pneumoniae]|uniref:hypothetical protein n=1 Tax=Klebsiella pneumoniae TaxID=573 RepID=UPI003013A361
DRFVSLKRYHHSRCDSSKPFVGRQHFSSLAGMKSRGEEDDDLEDGFSELETPTRTDENHASNMAHEDEDEDELISGSEISEE